MLDRFRKADEGLLAVPPQSVGEPLNGGGRGDGD
jgi:hypothetical protein